MIPRSAPALLVGLFLLLGAGALGGPKLDGRRRTGTGLRLESITQDSAGLEIWESVWHDRSRGRDVPVRILLPAQAEGSAELRGKTPLLLWSHGLGGTAQSNRYLLEAWAAAGYAVLAMQHAGSDLAALRSAGLLRLRRRFREVYEDAQAREDRRLDVGFVLDELERRAERDPRLRGRIDLATVGLGGHSFGAFTTMACLGASFEGTQPAPGGHPVSRPEPRIQAGIAMSPQGPGSFGFGEDSWGSVQRPFLSMTGTEDQSFVSGDSSPRRVAFERSTKVQRIHITLEGAEHHAFGESKLRGGKERHPSHHPWIVQASLAWWDAQLRGDEAASSWLKGKSLEKESRGQARVELGAAATSAESR